MSETAWLHVVNSSAYSAAAVLLLSALEPQLRTDRRAVFLTMEAVSLLLIALPHLIMPSNVCILTAFAVRRTRKPGKAFYYGLSVVFLLWLAIVIVSGIVMLAVPRWQGGVGYNLFMAAATIAAAQAYCRIPGFPAFLCGIRHTGLAVAVQLSVLLFFSLVLPRLYPFLPIQRVRYWGILFLALAVLLVLVLVIFAQLERQAGREQAVRRQYDSVVVLKHHYSKLYHTLAPYIRENDMDGLHRYFEQYITPIHRVQIAGMGKLADIHSAPIRKLLEETAAQLDMQEHTVLELLIRGTIIIPARLEMDVFEILCILIDNALRELEGQDDGLLQIEVKGNGGDVSIKIGNTLRDGFTMARLYPREPDREAGHGYGLRRVRELVCRRAMEHYTYIVGEHRNRRTLVQQIVIKGG